MVWCVSLLAVDNPLLPHDPEGRDPPWGRASHDGLRSATASMRRWLWTWADGGTVRDDASGR